MVIQLTESEINELKNIWQIIIWRMDVHKITPQRLAILTEYSLNFILKGIKGEAALITDTFLRNCVTVFGVTNSRTDLKKNMNVNHQLSREECIDLLKPPPAMPPNKKHFWEND